MEQHCSVTVCVCMHLSIRTCPKIDIKSGLAFSSGTTLAKNCGYIIMFAF